MQKYAETLFGATLLGAALLLAGRGMRTAWASEPAGAPDRQAADTATPPTTVQPGGDVTGICVRKGKTLATTSPTQCTRAGGTWNATHSGKNAAVTEGTEGASGGRSEAGGPKADSSNEAAPDTKAGGTVDQNLPPPPAATQPAP